MRLTILFLFTVLFSSLVYGQNSLELATKQGFKEIKLLNDVSTVKTSEVYRSNGSARYRYAGDSKTVYNTSINFIYIETDQHSLIRAIKIHLKTLDDDTFFALGDQMKSDFGKPCLSFTEKDNSGNGTLGWKTNELYMDYLWSYVSWGKWEPVIVIGLLQDLPPEIRKLHENFKDGF